VRVRSGTTSPNAPALSLSRRFLFVLVRKRGRSCPVHRALTAKKRREEKKDSETKSELTPPIGLDGSVKRRWRTLSARSISQECAWKTGILRGKIHEKELWFGEDIDAFKIKEGAGKTTSGDEETGGGIEAEKTGSLH